MRKLYLHIGDFVYGWIPADKRLNIRLQLFTKLVTPFKVMMDEYVAWRDTKITAAQVTGETSSLQWYLNLLFDPTNQGISIETAPVSGVAAGVFSFSEPYIVAGATSESSGSLYSVITPKSEVPVYGTNSFVVYVPTALTAQQEAIKTVVRKYKAAGKSFKIILV